MKASRKAQKSDAGLLARGLLAKEGSLVRLRHVEVLQGSRVMSVESLDVYPNMIWTASEDKIADCYASLQYPELLIGILRAPAVLTVKEINMSVAILCQNAAGARAARNCAAHS